MKYCPSNTFEVNLSRYFNPIVHGEVGVNLPPLSDFFNNFFFTQTKSLKFSDFKFLSFRHNVAKFH